MEKCGAFIWINLSLLHPRWFVPPLVKIDPVVLEKKIDVFSLFRYNLPMEKCRAFIWMNLSLLHPRWFVPPLVEIGPMILERKIFKFHGCVFDYSIITISPWKRVWPFIWTNARMRRLSLVANWPRGLLYWNKNTLRFDILFDHRYMIIGSQENNARERRASVHWTTDPSSHSAILDWFRDLHQDSDVR